MISGNIYAKEDWSIYPPAIKWALGFFRNTKGLILMRPDTLICVGIM